MTDGTSAAFSLSEACRGGELAKVLEATTRYGPTTVDDDETNAPPATTINATDGEGRTALHWAIGHKQPALATALLKEHGASSATVDVGGLTPLMTACAVQAPVELVELLLAAAPAPTPLTPRTSAERIRRSIADVADTLPSTAAASSAPATTDGPATAAATDATLKWVNRHDEMGNSALALAASRGYKQAVRLLLAAGADPFSRNNRGQSCLHRVVGRGDMSLVEEVISHVRKHHLKLTKRFVNAQDANGDTALHYAAMENNKELGETLLRNGADRDITNRQGKAFWQL